MSKTKNLVGSPQIAVAALILLSLAANLCRPEEDPAEIEVGVGDGGWELLDDADPVPRLQGEHHRPGGRHRVVLPGETGRGGPDLGPPTKTHKTQFSKNPKPLPTNKQTNATETIRGSESRHPTSE